MSKVVKWTIVVFLAWWVIKDPTAAGAEVGKLAAFATHAAGSLATAISSI